MFHYLFINHWESFSYKSVVAFKDVSFHSIVWKKLYHLIHSVGRVMVRLEEKRGQSMIERISKSYERFLVPCRKQCREIFNNKVVAKLI